MEKEETFRITMAELVLMEVSKCTACQGCKNMAEIYFSTIGVSTDATGEESKSE